LAIKNTGTKSVTISQVKINNNVAQFDPATFTLISGATSSLTVYGTYGAWVAGNPYKMDLVDSSGQVVGSYQATAPQ
jgi:hypothetical protein